MRTKGAALSSASNWFVGQPYFRSIANTRTFWHLQGFQLLGSPDYTLRNRQPWLEVLLDLGCLQRHFRPRVSSTSSTLKLRIAIWKISTDYIAKTNPPSCSGIRMQSKYHAHSDSLTWIESGLTCLRLGPRALCRSRWSHLVLWRLRSTT
ncbi:hypothetical protein GALMADRAFT_739330 [Galerina marginata CBS 339.88]|uniref:Uncharacterized protein n=1 Tax=Galerina marginata (strain CBS 339.88) TaxID=685588 RepID=A0A067SPQ7_GALM3|nr:hypothetical protein GALMADRAFT_739330 [Galerina marginata CBS 339.88]